MDENNADDLLFVNLDVGTLAIIVLVVVTTCSVMTLFSLFCWNRSSSHTSLHCARCHQAIGVYGLPLPPQSVPPVHPYNVVPSGPPLSFQFQPPPHNTLSAKPAQYSQQAQNLPAIVINQPDNVQCGDSATFQRLGMRRPDSGMGTDARTLETRALSQVQASPPEVTTPGLEPLTPSPVLSGNHQDERRRQRVKYAEDPSPYLGVSYEQSCPEPSKLQQVRMVNFPSFQTPCAKTPSNAVKPKRSSLKGTYHGQRSVTTLQPSQLFLAGHDKQSDQPLLDVSEMCRTAITTGDLKDLCEDTAEAETSFTNPNQAILTPATVSLGAAFTPSPGVTLTPAATITPASGSLGIPAPQSSLSNPSPLTSLNSTLTPSNQYLPSPLDQYQLSQQPPQFVTDRRAEPSPHLAITEYENRVNTRGKEMSPNIVIDGQDAKVVDRRSLSSPHLAIIDHEKNVTDRRSLAGGGTAPLPITSSDTLMTMRKEQYNTSPGNVFVFNKNFDPTQPHQETVHGQYHHLPLSEQHTISPGPSINNNTYKRKSSHPPSKIPINEGYLERSGGSLKRAKAAQSVDPSGDGQTAQNQGLNLDKSGGKVTSKPQPPVLDKSGGSGKKVKYGTPVLDKIGGKVTPKPQLSVQDQSGGSGKKLSCGTPVLDKSVTSSGRKLPPSYPDRPGTGRKPAGNTGTYTKPKSPNI